jgi:hypothetical protein
MSGELVPVSAAAAVAGVAGWYVPAGQDHCPRCGDTNFDERRRCITCTDGDDAYADGLFADGWSADAGELARRRFAGVARGRP